MNRSMVLGWATLLLVGGSAVAQIRSDPEAEKIQQLVGKIQKEMREIDQLLLRADQPQEAAKKIDETIKNIQDLLKAADSRQSSVVKNLDALVKLAKYQKSQQQSASRPPEQGKPKGEEEQQQQRPKDKQPDDLQKQPEQQQQEQPKGGKDDSAEAQQKPANQPPPTGDKSQYKRSDLSDRWGVLPPKDQEDLINALNGRWPERYRRWIDEYFRRVNRTKR